MSAAKKQKTCGLKDCKGPLRAMGLCQKHYQAIHVRKVPIERFLEGTSEPLKLKDAVSVSVRLEREVIERLDAAIKSGRVGGPRYTFLQNAISEAVSKI